MPFVIPIITAIAAGISEIGVGIGALGAAIGIGSGVVAGTGAAFMLGFSAIAIGAQFLISGLARHSLPSGSPSTLTSDSASHSVAVRQSASPRRVIYGRAPNGGVVTYTATTGTTGDFLHLVVTLAGHECDAIEAIWFNDYQLTLSSGDHGDETGKYAGFCTIERKLGAPGEAAFPGLITDTAGMAGNWTSAHRQDGCCSIHVKLTWSQALFANGVPTIYAVLRGKKVFDPRSSTTAWSNNTALCVRDYLQDTRYGLRALAGELNDVSMIAAANQADTAITLAGGGTEPQYACNGAFDCSQVPGDVLKGLLSSGAGKLSYVGGQWSQFLGAWRSPAAFFGDDDLRGALVLTAGIGRRNLYSGVKGTFLSALNNWQVSDFPSKVKASYVADDSGIVGCADRGTWATATGYLVNDAVMSGGQAYACTVAHTSGASTQPGVGASWATVWVYCAEMNWRDVQYPFTTSSATAQRLAKIELERGRRQLTLAAPCKLRMYEVAAPDVVAFTHARWGWTDRTFEIATAQLISEPDTALGVDLNLVETDAAVYAWDPSEEQAFLGTLTPAQWDSGGGGDGAIQPVTSMTAVSNAGTHVTSGPRIRVNWVAPADSRVTSGGYIIVSYADHGVGNWTDYPRLSGTTTQDYIGYGDLAGSSVYDVRVVAYSASGAASAPTYVNNITAYGSDGL